MRILHTADWHLGKNVNNYSMLEDQKYVLNQIKEIAINNAVDVILISGDIYDRAIPAYDAIKVFEEFIIDMIKKHNKKIILISGNHDSERISFGNELFAKNNLFITSEISDIMIDGVHFYMIPYFNIYQFRQILGIDVKTTEEAYKYIVSNLNLDMATYNVLLAHDYVTHNMDKLLSNDEEVNLSMGGMEYVEADIFKDFNYVALGHMHQAQRVGYDKIRYSGSILKYSFSEVNHKKSVTVVDTYSGIEVIPLKPLKDMIIIKGLLSDLIKPEFYNNYDYKNDYFKAVLLDEDEVLDAYYKLKCVYPNLMEIFKERITMKFNQSKQEILTKTTLELFNDFYSNVVGKELTKEENELVVKYLKKDI